MADDYSVFSSGGVGDALIVGLKIQKMRDQNGTGRYHWEHREKHACHAEPCHQVMDCFAESAEFILSDQPEKEAMAAKAGVNGIYLDTRVNWVPDPYLKFGLGTTFFMGKQNTLSKGADNPHWGGTLDFKLERPIVVQMAAGRMHDRTKRTVDPLVISRLRECLPDRPVVMLGPEPIQLKMEGVLNWTGQTGDNIRHAFSCIDECSLFVGQDGVLAYYAMMQKKPTIVAYHIQTLPGHYWNNAWAKHSLALLGAGNHLPALPINEKVSLLMEMAR